MNISRHNSRVLQVLLKYFPNTCNRNVLFKAIVFLLKLISWYLQMHFVVMLKLIVALVPHSADFQDILSLSVTDVSR